MRILMIEDDHATAQSMELMLKSEGHNVRTTDLGEEGIDLAKTLDLDLILLDLNLPDMNGFQVLEQVRQAEIKTPVIIVTGSSDVAHKVRALKSGADDYMTKPFHRDELLAVSNAVVRRSQGHAHAVMTCGNLEMDLDLKTVKVRGQHVHITASNYKMLELLMLRKGTTLTKEMFLNHLYNGRDEPEMKIIDVFICKLRKAIGDANGGIHYIETVWGRGYVLHEPEPVAQEEPAPLQAASG